MNTTENNILIAEFMSLDILYDNKVHHHTAEKNKVTTIKYDSSYEWIIEVLEKIESLGFETSLTNKNFFIRIGGSNTQNGLMYRNKKQAIYLTIVEFIQWYNSKQS